MHAPASALANLAQSVILELYMKISVIGIVIFLVLGIAFFAWFGGPPSVPADSYLSHRGTTRAWFYCSILFLTGAGTACFGDKEYGMFPPTSLRWLFIVLGVFIMAASAAWMHSLTSFWSEGKSVSSSLSNEAQTRHGAAPDHSWFEGATTGIVKGPCGRTPTRAPAGSFASRLWTAAAMSWQGSRWAARTVASSSAE